MSQKVGQLNGLDIIVEAILLIILSKVLRIFLKRLLIEFSRENYLTRNRLYCKSTSNNHSLLPIHRLKIIHITSIDFAVRIKHSDVNKVI